MKATPASQSTSAVIARLKAELALNRDFAGTYEVAFLAMAWTWQRLERMGRQFFAAYGITDVQFNVLMILHDYDGKMFRQHELAAILVVNRASIGGVLERMEIKGWIARVVDPEDRRAQRVRVTKQGRSKLEEVRAPYYRQLGALFKRTDDANLMRHVVWFDALRRSADQLEKSHSGASPESK
jgi:DNA-binding MarR family transcriptional regulator